MTQYLVKIDVTLAVEADEPEFAHRLAAEWTPYGERTGWSRKHGKFSVQASAWNIVSVVEPKSENIT